MDGYTRKGIVLVSEKSLLSEAVLLAILRYVRCDLWKLVGASTRKNCYTRMKKITNTEVLYAAQELQGKLKITYHNMQNETHPKK